MKRLTGCLAPISFVTLLIGLSSACGPAISTPTISDAELAIEEARLEQAELYATFEFVSAVEYLDKAEEEWSFSDFQHAEEYASRALAFARAALARAVANPDRSVEPINPLGDFRLGDPIDDDVEREFRE